MPVNAFKWKHFVEEMAVLQICCKFKVNFFATEPKEQR